MNDLNECAGFIHGEKSNLRCESIARLKSSPDLPSIPSVVAELMVIIDDHESSIRDIQDIVKKDQVVAALILKMANSIIYNRLGIKISNIEKAIVRIGVNETINIVMSVSLMSKVVFPAKIFVMKKLWVHSYATGVISEHLSKKVDPDQEKISCSTVFTAGLLHEIGKVAIASVLDLDYFNKDISQLTGMELLNEEYNQYGLNHADAGFVVLNEWNMPSDISAIVLDCGRRSDDISPKMIRSRICLVASNIADEYLADETDFFSVSLKIPEIMEQVNIEYLFPIVGT